MGILNKGDKLVNRILKDRGVSKEELKKSREEEFEWEEMDLVVTKVAEELILGGGDNKVGVLYDVDVDGLFSGYIVEDFLKRYGIYIKRYMNKNKEHGLTDSILKDIKADNLDWLFIVDGGSGDGKNINELTREGCKVVVLDHHPYELDEEIDNTKSWILNIKDKEDLPLLSGSGVVYRFIEKLGNLFDGLTGQYEKFVGITVLSDMCDMSEPENRYYVKRSYEEYRGNRFLQQFRFYGSGKSFYSFSVVPYLNACIRVGEEEHAMEIVNNMNNIAKMNKIERDRYRVLDKQQGMLREIVKESKLLNLEDIVLLLRTSRKDLKPVGGLLANKLVSKFQKPALVLYREGKEWLGSFRSNSFTREVLEEYGFKTEGHDKACGVKVENHVLNKFRKVFKYEGEIQKEYFSFTAGIGELSEREWRSIAEYNEFSGVGMDSILVRLKEKVSESLYVGGISDKKKEIVFEEGEVIDFTGKKDDEIIVEPVLKGTSYQLVRI